MEARSRAMPCATMPVTAAGRLYCSPAHIDHAIHQAMFGFLFRVSLFVWGLSADTGTKMAQRLQSPLQGTQRFAGLERSSWMLERQEARGLSFRKVRICISQNMTRNSTLFLERHLQCRPGRQGSSWLSDL